MHVFICLFLTLFLMESKLLCFSPPPMNVSGFDHILSLSVDESDFDFPRIPCKPLPTTTQRPSSALASSLILKDLKKIKADDIAGLELAKRVLNEAILLPQQHPHLFRSHLASPPKGILLFGCPGSGKSILARWACTELQATFFSVSASTIMSKWIGESERAIREVFEEAQARQPSIIFIDEVDSLLSKRNSSDHDAIRRTKNELLVCMEGISTNPKDSVVVIGATNLPWEIDEAALRRFHKKIYVPLPDESERIAFIKKEIERFNQQVEENTEEEEDKDISILGTMTDGYSCSDLRNVLQEAVMATIRECLNNCDSRMLSGPKQRKLTIKDITRALKVTPASNTSNETSFIEWNLKYGAK
jgi:SpoVK/Ycf46/Vps4 family AAA+-type ATPase